MLQSVKQVDGAKIIGSDGELGEVEDVYFDDEKWVARYLVVGTGSWLTRQHVLISPYAIWRVDLPAHAVATRLTREQVRKSPDIDTDKPVSRQHELEYYRYFDYPPYWPATTYWAWGALPTMPAPRAAGPPPPDPRSFREPNEAEVGADTHLRSAKAVRGYHVQATDDRMGHVEDFLFGDETWAIRYLVIDTRNWWPGRHVLISPQWARSVDWPTRTLTIDLTRAQIERSPRYDPDHLPSRDYEEELHRHYARRVYW